MKLVLLFVFVNAALFGQHSDFSHINFKKADSIADLNYGKSLKNLPFLTYNLTSNLNTDVEKFRAIYTWISTNITNDYSSYLKTRKKRKKLAKNKEALLEWNTDFTPKVFENLLKYKKTACTGYAYLLREMATLADIECKIVNGYGRTATLILNENSIPNHSWNTVKLNDKWHLCDPTWSAGRIIIEDNIPRFEADYFDGYFLADPTIFIKNHYPLEIASTLLDTPPTFIEFIKGPVVYKEAFKPLTIPISPSQMRLQTLKNKPVFFKLILPNSTTKNIELLLKNGSSSKTVLPKITNNTNGCVLAYSFEKSGDFDVHIKVDDVIIATYVVKVRRK